MKQPAYRTMLRFGGNPQPVLIVDDEVPRDRFCSGDFRPVYVTALLRKPPQVIKGLSAVSIGYRNWRERPRNRSECVSVRGQLD